MADAMRGRVVVDGRNALPGTQISSVGLTYHAYGRPGSGSLIDLHRARHADPGHHAPERAHEEDLMEAAGSVA
jgi:hypothetical protein